MKRTILAAKFSAYIGLAVFCMTPAHAGIPVIDATNLSQNVVTAMENVAHTLKQIEQYQTQLQQYENQLRNTVAPAAYIWDRATGTMNALRSSIDTLNYYKQQLGNIDTMLNKYQDVSYYKNSSCFQSRGCTEADRATLNQNRAFLSESQKRANDALMRGIERQQDALITDAGNLERLQNSAQTAGGQLEAIGYANQLASHQSNQLLQIRALLIAQQNAMAASMQARADKEARSSTLSKQLTGGAYRGSAADTF